MAEFDELFTAVLRFDRSQPTRLDLVLLRDAEATRRSRNRESQCCSFFVFDFEHAGDDVVMHIGVPSTQVGVLDSLQARLEH